MFKKLRFGLGALCLAGMLSLTVPVVTEAATGDVTINAANFPDKGFRKYVKKEIDKNKDGVLSRKEQDAVTYILARDYKIKSLKGIECFGNLKSLDVRRNEITTAEFSKNPNLEDLEIATNALKSIDISKNTKLTGISCGGNKLTSLDVSNNLDLELLQCCDNEITELNVTKNRKLKHLDCAVNKLTNLNLANNKELEMLFVENNQIKAISIAANTKLNGFRCQGNPIQTMDICKNPKLLNPWLLDEKPEVDKDGNSISYNSDDGQLTVSQSTKVIGPHDQWYHIGSKWFRFAANGTMLKGWKQVDGTWYYFKKNGRMASKEWIGGYWLAKNGSWTYKAKASWKKTKKGWMYKDTSGWFAKNTKITIDGKKYSFDKKGYLKK